MLSVYMPKGTTLARVNVESGAVIPENAVWIDMVTPSVQEDQSVEQLIGIAVRTREEMQEIESSRESGVGWPTIAVSCQRGRQHEMAEGHTRTTSIHAPRRRVVVGPRHLSPSCSTQCSVS